MNVLGISGSSGSGKTRLAQKLIALFDEQGYRVSVVKHAHHNVEVDTPGKDSWMLRKAGAYETLLVSDQRWMLVREFEEEQQTTDIHEVIQQISPCDWLIIEGFKHADLNKIEVWRERVGKAPLYLNDPYVKAVVTDQTTGLAAEIGLPVFDLDDVQSLYQWVLENHILFNYTR